MKRHFILFAIAFAAALSGVAKTFDVDISTGRPAASNEAYYHGETIEFRAVRGRSVVTNVEYSCVYYQTNGMDSVWWHTDGLVFHPTNDVGAASYRFFLEGRDDLGRDWHANGLLRLLPSPGFTPNEIELPVARLDFAAVEVANAPYYDKAETEAKIVELAPAPDYSTNNAELVETIHQTEVDPTVPAWAKKTIGGFYSDDLYSLVNRDFYANDSSIHSQYSIWLKGSPNPTVTVGRDKLSDNTFPYARQTVRGFSAYEGLDYYAHYRPRGIYIWPWWNEDAEDDIAYLFPTNGNGGTFALTSDIPSAAIESNRVNIASNSDAISTLTDTTSTLNDSISTLSANKADRSELSYAISPTSPAFSNAVLSVGLGIDTNTVAVINELVDSAHDLPVTGATSVGALLLALAAAVAALKKRLPYALVTKTIADGAVTLDDRASNAVEISATLSPNTLTINFPAATSGKVRDFALRLNIASGVTAPELVLPQGVVCENADGEVPEISDGGTGGSSTILYFSETENDGTTAKFLLKGETLAAITQA